MWSRNEIDALYRRTRPAMVRRAAMLLGETAEAHDVAQEVFTALLESPDQFRHQSQAMTYLFAMTTKQSISRLRKRLLRHEAWEQAVRVMWTYAIPASEPDLVSEAKQLVERALRDADEVTAQIVIGCCFDWLSQQEMSDVVGLSRVTVNQRLQAFRVSVRQEAP